jgi:transcriptional regulator with XRE-family HTH domain
VSKRRARALHVAIGEQLRQLREARGVRQEDVAAGARRIGLRWNRPTVALVENGFRQLSIGELLAMPVIYMVIMKKELGSPSWEPKKMLTLGDLLPAKGWAEIGRGCTLPASMLQDVANGNLEVTSFPPDFLVSRESDEDVLEDDALGDAEGKAARRLKVSTVEVAKAAREIWGHSLTEERDRRVVEKREGVSSPRTLQALRGHVSRALTEVLSTVLVKSSSAKTGSFARIHDAASQQRRVRRRRRQADQQL